MRSNDQRRARVCAAWVAALTLGILTQSGSAQSNSAQPNSQPAPDQSQEPQSQEPQSQEPQPQDRQPQERSPSDLAAPESQPTQTLPASETLPGDRPPHFVVLRLSSAMLNSLASKQIDVQAPVRDVILGTPISGNARITGQSQVVLEPSFDQARFAVVVKGVVYSRTVGNGGPVTLHGHSITHFTATGRITFEPGKGFQGRAPEIAASTQVFTDRIVPNRGGIIGRIIQRRAWEQVASQKPQVTAIARQRATARIARAFESHMTERLARLNRAVEFRTLLVNLRDQAAGTPQVICSTTPQYVEIADTLASDRSSINLPVLSAASTANAPIELWIHQRIVPEPLAKALKAALASPDQNALIQALAVLPGPVGKEAAAGVAKFVSDNQINVETLGDWTVVEVTNRPAATAVLSQNLHR